jgi:hypothetical protein
MGQTINENETIIYGTKWPCLFKLDV